MNNFLQRLLVKLIMSFIWSVLRVASIRFKKPRRLER